MRHPQPPPDRPSVRALIALAITYTVAAGLHGVLTVVLRTWWSGVLTAILAAVAVAFSLAARARAAPRVAIPDPRPATAREEPAVRRHVH